MSPGRQKDFEMSRMRKVYAISIKQWNAPSLMELGLDGVLYYLGYRTNLGEYDPNYHTIVKDYGFIDTDDEKEEFRIRIEHANDYAPKKANPTKDACLGWIAPNGDFYPCRLAEHSGTIHHLYVIQTGTWTDKRSDVEQWATGWLSVEKDSVFKDRNVLTQPQIDTLGDVLIVTDGDELKRYIRMIIPLWQD